MKMIWLDTNLYSGSKMKVDVTGMTITSADGTQKNEYSFSNGKLLHPGSLWGYRDSDEEKNYAATILNPYLAYHYYVADYCNNYREEYTSYGFNEWDMIDLFSEKILTLGAGSVIEVAVYGILTFQRIFQYEWKWKCEWERAREANGQRRHRISITSFGRRKAYTPMYPTRWIRLGIIAVVLPKTPTYPVIHIFEQMVRKWMRQRQP